LKLWLPTDLAFQAGPEAQKPDSFRNEPSTADGDDDDYPQNFDFGVKKK